MDHFPMLVSQHLKLYVARVLEEFFRVNVRRAEGLLRFATSRLVSGQQLILLAHHTHAAAASARGGLENQGIPDVRCLLRELLFSLDDALTSRNSGQARGLYFPSRAVLFPHHFYNFRLRADKRDFRSFSDLGDVAILAQEPVPAVYPIH